MRNVRRVAVRNRGSVYQQAAANHDWFLFNFGEASGATVSDRSGSVSALTLSGTTTGVWANPTRGITPATDTAAQLKTSAVSTSALDRLARIYQFDAGAVGRLQYILFRMGLNAAPASDTANYLLSLGRQGAGGSTDAFGQLSIRINATRVPNLELRKRGTLGTLATIGSGQALATGSPGVARSYLVLLSETNAGADLQVDWFADGGANPTNSNSIAGGIAAGPLRNDAAGAVILGRGSPTNPYAPANQIGSGSVAPVVEWLGFGACADNAGNRAAIVEAWQGYHALRDMPAAFGRITR